MFLEFRSLLYFIVAVLFSIELYSQECDCPFQDELKNDIERLYSQGKPDSVDVKLERIKKESTACLIFYVYQKAKYFQEKRTFDSALHYVNRLGDLVNESKCRAEFSRYYFTRGNTFAKQGVFDSAMVWLLRALDVSEKNKDTAITIKTLHTLSYIFSSTFQYEKAGEYAQKALRISIAAGDVKEELMATNNLIFDYGLMYEKTKSVFYLDSVRNISSRAIFKAKQFNLTDELLRTYSALTSLYYLTGNFAKAIMYCDSVIASANPARSFNQIHMAYSNICDINLETGDYKKAKIAADSALVYAKKSRDLTLFYNAYIRLYEVEKKSGNYEAALTYYEEYTKINDSLRSGEQLRIVNELEGKYNKVQNEKKINELNNESQIKGLRIKILIIGIALSLTIIIVIIFLYRQSVIKNKQKILETEQRLNRSRINPHFFFNAITTLQGIALKESDGKKVALNLYKFSNLMRQTLESSYNDYVTIDAELEFINQYIELQKLKEDSKFVFSAEISPELETSDVLVPAMLIQPFMENSIEHGFSNLGYEGKLTLRISTDKAKLKISITDNGRGISNNETKENKHISRAMQITKDRLFLINKERKCDANYSITPNQPSGVVVEILLPLIYK